jgi:hypothetical protein
VFEILLPALGVLVGFLVGLTGIGGAALMTPALIFLGVPPVVAVGTDLTYNTVTKSLGATLHAVRRNIDYSLLRRLLLGSVPALVAGYVILTFLRGTYPAATVNYVVTVLVAAVLLLTATFHLSRGKWQDSSTGNGPIRSPNGPRLLEAPVAGFSVGLAVQFTSVGSGSLMMPFLMRALPSAKRMVGTDIFYGLVVSGLSAASQATLGTVDLPVAALLLLGAIPGVVVGVRLNSHIETKQLRRILGVLILVAGLSLVAKLWLGSSG